MKIDRLLAIITYLLNHDLVTGRHLAEKFGVTERTIQRDVDTINLAGIPILSIRGTNGGYKIMDTYRLGKQTATDKDLESITMALRSLNSALDNQKLQNTLEKAISIAPSKRASYINIDFSIAKENKKISKHIKVIEEAIKLKLKIEISYTNAGNYTTKRVVEPVSLEFKWYTWYLVAYCTECCEYRIFKLIRIAHVKLTDNHFVDRHSENSSLFDQLMNRDRRKTTKVAIKCDKDIITAVEEYLSGAKIVEAAEEFYMVELNVMESERLWFAFLLSFGDKVKIIEPEHIKKSVVEHCKKIIDRYEIPDS
ncbi:MAG: helix-turn-helix transcriptional regulator [Bacillota bacterium]